MSSTFRTSSIRANAEMYISRYLGNAANSFARLLLASGQPMQPTRSNPQSYRGFRHSFSLFAYPQISSSVQSIIGLTTRFALSVQVSNSCRLSSLSDSSILFCRFVVKTSNWLRFFVRATLSAHRTPVAIMRPLPVVSFSTAQQ